MTKHEQTSGDQGPKLRVQLSKQVDAELWWQVCDRFSLDLTEQLGEQIYWHISGQIANSPCGELDD